MLDQALKGDLRERVDGGFEGWCWAPDRPEERLVVDLLVNDTVASSIMAASFRRDLLLRGIGDGRHGFTLRLPPNLPETNSEHIVTARERTSHAVFGRVLRGAGATVPGGERLEGVAEAMDELWRRLEVARAARATPTAADRLRDAFGQLAGRLAARAAAGRVHRDVGLGTPQAGASISLPNLASPQLSVVLRATGAQEMLRRLAALAPAAELAGAEFIVVDPGHDPDTALLAARVRNLRYLRDAAAVTAAAAANLAAPLARGARLLLLGEAPAEPSAAALLALVHAAARAGPALLLGPAASAAMAAAGPPAPPEIVRLQGSLGFVVCIDRLLWQQLGPFDTQLDDGASLECADLAFRAQLLGLNVYAVAEPRRAAPTSMAAGNIAPAVAQRALAAFGQRWGTGNLDPSHRPA